MVCWRKIYLLKFILIGFLGYCQDNNLLKAFDRADEKKKLIINESLKKSISKVIEEKKEIELKKKEEIRKDEPSKIEDKYHLLKYNSLKDIINPLRPQDWKGISSKFGFRIHPVLKTIKHHTGIDIPAPTGVPVYTVLDGIIIATGYDNINGNYIKIDHGNGLMTSYAHLSKIEVKNNQKVKRGKIIGKVGATGRVTGSHLHYTLFIKGIKTNPEKYLLWK